MIKSYSGPRSHYRVGMYIRYDGQFGKIISTVAGVLYFRKSESAVVKPIYGVSSEKIEILTKEEVMWELLKG